jgi:hypothetical protein
VSSLQSIESSFFLIALHRRPHALTTFVAGVESALQGAELDSKKGESLQNLIRNARPRSPRLRQLPDAEVDTLRLARNRFTHRGFSPRDDSEAVELFVRIAVPLAEAVYFDLHGFQFREALFQEFAQLLSVGTAVCARARSADVVDLSYSLNAFSHLIRWRWQENFSTDWQLKALERAEQIGARFHDIREEKEELEGCFSASCILDCPVCGGIDDAVCELDPETLKSRQLTPLRFACANCGFVVRSSEPFLSEALLVHQLAEHREMILADYGLR